MGLFGGWFSNIWGLVSSTIFFGFRLRPCYPTRWIMYRIIVHEALSVGWGVLGRGFSMEDGLLMTNAGDDGEGMDGWLRVKGMMRMRRWIPAYDLRG
jgi:hypothetical protein